MIKPDAFAHLLCAHIELAMDLVDYSWDEITATQALIEKCMKSMMTSTEIFATLEKDAKVAPHFSLLVSRT